MRCIIHSPLLLLACLLLIGSCKHRQKEVVAVRKNPPKKQNTKQVDPPNGREGTADFYEVQQKLGLSNKEVRNSRLYSFVSEWYGVPYKYAGCQKSGVDCSCFLNILYEKVYDKKISRTTGEMYASCDKLSPDEMKEGDLLFFRMYGNGVTHVGLFLKNNYFVHSSTSKGVIISNLDEAYYKKYFFCAGKFKNA